MDTQGQALQQVDVVVHYVLVFEVVRVHNEVVQSVVAQKEV